MGGFLSVMASAMTLSIDDFEVSSAEAVAMVVMEGIERALDDQSCQQSHPSETVNLKPTRDR